MASSKGWRRRAPIERPPMGDLELAAVAHRQLGPVTRGHALARLSRKTAAFRVASRRPEVVRRGVYRFAGSPAVPGQAQLAACLTAGPSAVASHRAAGLWGMPGLRSDGPELTVPWARWPRLRGVTSDQTRHLPTSHCAMVGPVPVTSPARTLADLAPSLVDSSLRRRISLDLADPDARLGVEHDGWDFHRTTTSFDHDRRRGNALALAGWTVLSFTSASDRGEMPPR